MEGARIIPAVSTIDSICAIWKNKDSQQHPMLWKLHISRNLERRGERLSGGGSAKPQGRYRKFQAILST